MKVSGASNTTSSRGVVETVTMSPATRFPIPTKSTSSGKSVNTPPSVVTAAVGTIWTAAVPMESFEGSSSISAETAGWAAASNR
jgi:hypothetical protein